MHTLWLSLAQNHEPLQTKGKLVGKGKHIDSSARDI